MYLKKIELQGFKSFADKTIFEFLPGITAVIGPNGSGKSNVSDAVRWVLGEQSMKSLRGNKLEDIIFVGTQNRKSLGFAEVTLIIDNADGKLPIEFSEVTVTRRAYRSGESEFYINKSQCRLKDILELFMDTGIGKDGYSIIGQGKIDEILSNRSEERRNIFEEAAGIVKYKTRKEEANRKLEHTRQNIIRITDIITEIEANIEPLRIQSEKARRFLDLREELKKIEIGLFIDSIEKNKMKLEDINRNQDILNNQVLEEDIKLEELTGNKENIKLDLEQLIKDTEGLQTGIFENQNNMEKCNSDINLSKEKIKNNNINFERLSNEIEELKSLIESLEIEKQEKKDKKNRMLESKNKFVQELYEKEKELEELLLNFSEEETEIEKNKDKLNDLTNQKFENMSAINISENMEEGYIKRDKQVKEEISSNISELDSKRFIKNEISKVFYEINQKRSEISKKLEFASELRNESSNKISVLENKINKTKENIRVSEARYKFLVETEKEKEGYLKSVKALLLECEKNNELSNGVYGAIANLIIVPPEYELAIEMCLGMSLQNIVTDTEKDAKKLIEFLRKNNLGRASFLPIASVKGKKIDINIEKIKKNNLNVIGLASDLIKFDSKYTSVILNLLGKTLIVNDMDTAINIAKEHSYGFRIVTLSGDIVNPSGQMTRR